MAGRPRKNTSKSAKTTKAKKDISVAETVVETPVEEVVDETPVAVEAPAEVEEVKAEAIVEEAPAEEVKPEEIIIESPAEPKPKRKYTRKAKKEDTVEEVPAEKKPVKSSKTDAPEIKAYIQGAGAEKSLEELAEQAEKLSGVKSPKNVNLYIKPYEDDGTAKVYYVVDNIAGHFNLF